MGWSPAAGRCCMRWSTATCTWVMYRSPASYGSSQGDRI